jgi:hypothetical protein
MKTTLKPSLNYPFPDLINPFATEVENLVVQWIQQDYQSMPETYHQKKDGYRHKETLAGKMMARMYPYASLQQLTPIARFSLWGLSYDDFYEDCTTAELQDLRNRAVAVLRGYPLEPGENEIFRQLQLQRKEMLPQMSAAWMERYAQSISAGFEGMQFEAPYKAKMEFPGLYDYMAIREKAVLVYPLVVLLELQLEQPLPDEIANHPHMLSIAAITCRILAWCNDFFSLAKEIGKDVMNLVLVIQHHEKCTLEEAFAEAENIHNQDLIMYLNLCTNLPDFGKYNQLVNQFIEVNNLMIQGHKSWYEQDTVRYKVDRSAQP